MGGRIDKLEKETEKRSRGKKEREAKIESSDLQEREGCLAISCMVVAKKTSVWGLMLVSFR